MNLTLSSPQPRETSPGVPNSKEKLEIQGQTRVNYFGFINPKHPLVPTFIFFFFFFFWRTKRPEMFGFSLFFDDVILGFRGFASSCPQFPRTEIKGIWDFGKSGRRKPAAGSKGRLCLLRKEGRDQS